MSTKVKICGLSTPETVTAAIEGGADFLGFVFHASSPRFIETEVAAYLTSYVPEHIKTVGLFVDPADDLLQETLENVRLDMIQLHGQETPARVEDIRKMFKKPVIKALAVKEAGDVQKIAEFEQAADWILLDSSTGGTGQSFDWALLDGFSFAKPWMLAGGLTPNIVRGAIARLHPDAVDVSSGVESSRGVKDSAKIKAFIENARAA